MSRSGYTSFGLMCMKRPSFLPSMKAIVLAMIFGFRLLLFYVHMKTP